MCLQTMAARTWTSVGPCASDQFTVPSKNGVGRNDRRHLLEQSTPQSVSQFGEATPLVVLEPQAPSAKPGRQNSILFSQKRDQICLLTMKLRTQRHDELKRGEARSLSAVLIRFLDIAGPLTGRTFLAFSAIQ